MLHRAYNDALGITAAFNLNILTRLNRELGANFALDQFRHYAFYNPVFARVEMHLVSLRRTGRARRRLSTSASTAARASGPRRRTSTHRTSSPRWPPPAGWRVEQVWTDDRGLFSVQYLTVAD